MITPRWMYLAATILITSTLVVFSYPVPSYHEVSPLLEDINSEGPIFRRSPQPSKKRPKSSSPGPVAGPSNRRLPPAHQQSGHPHTPSGNPHTPSPPDSPKRGPMDFDPSPHAPTRFKNINAIKHQSTNLRADTLKSDNYREETMKAHPKLDWKGPSRYEADHLLEAQTVASKINKHKGSVNIKKPCLDAIRLPLNDQRNLEPLRKKLNGKKNTIVAAIARHDKYTHQFGPTRKADGKTVKPSRGKGKRPGKKLPASKEELGPIPEFTKKGRKHIVDNQERIIETAKAVDKAIMSHHCTELHGTKLYTEPGKITAQARILIGHAKKTDGLSDSESD